MVLIYVLEAVRYVLADVKENQSFTEPQINLSFRESSLQLNKIS